MKIFTNDNIHAIERVTCESQGITEMELVARVAEQVTAEISARWRPSKSVVIFAGPGNNGADALSAGRLLLEQGYTPQIYLFNIKGMKINDLCRRCRDSLLSAFPSANFTEVIHDFDLPDLNSRSLVVDGLFGSGLRSPLEGGFKSLVRYINESHASVVSIDLPSGLFPDWNPQAVPRDIIHATLTLSVQFPHPAFMFKENAQMVGEWKTLDIGLSYEAIQKANTPFHYVELPEVQHLLRRRQEFSSKADYGSALIVAGSQGMMGAATFAAEGALRAGAGKVTLHVPQCGLDVAQVRVPEAMCSVDMGRTTISDIDLSRPYDAYGVGPGIGTSTATIGALDKFLKRVDRPVVLDADALNCIAESPILLNYVPKLSVLTPHAGEFDRLFGQCQSDEARLHKALEISRHNHVLIVLKGRYTALVRPDGKIYFNSSGTPALATPGAGDVLTGVITGLMAQGYKPEVSALIGVFVHGRAGELAARHTGQYGLTASTLAQYISESIHDIMNI